MEELYQRLTQPSVGRDETWDDGGWLRWDGKDKDLHPTPTVPIILNSTINRPSHPS